MLAITELATTLTEHARNTDLELAVETEPACWRHAIDGQAALKPDLAVRIADADTELSWFIEIDRSTESGTVLAKKLKRYDRYWRTGTEQANRGVFPKVLWIAPTPERAEYIRLLSHDRQLNPQLFDTATPDTAVDQLTNFTESSPQ